MKNFKEFLIENDNYDIFDKIYSVSKKIKSVSFNKFVVTKDNFIEINSDINISYMNISNLKDFFENLTIKNVNGNFDCSNNNLTSLYGSPMRVNNFDCYNNKLVNFKYAPVSINNLFDCRNNLLTSLEGCPEILAALDVRNNNYLIDISGFLSAKNRSNAVIYIDKNLPITLVNAQTLYYLNMKTYVDWNIKSDIFNLTEDEFLINCVKYNPENVKNILNPNDEIIHYIYKNCPEYIRYLPYDKQTKLTRYGL